ncbi:unnamed protein product [Darwinula stevensoni]|uniref:diacylglycerol cholinephosphotransferase n=1 Tax=Darwinula stevensoni TaxID=69355 RepID=A0A7R9A635_9CRUS|nr:unnamed protein product [Darwinula stevensoni]CAG0893323.1 unnamed protein product [Darwinula stevensoni]
MGEERSGDVWVHGQPPGGVVGPGIFCSVSPQAYVNYWIRETSSVERNMSIFTGLSLEGEVRQCGYLHSFRHGQECGEPKLPLNLPPPVNTYVADTVTLDSSETSMMTNFGKRLNGEIRRANQVLTPLQLKKLSEHKYNCDSKSLLDPFLQPYWNWLVKQVPVWMAPNFITISGLLVNVVTSLILFFYSPDGVHPPPRWACLLCAAGIFIYQSLDAIDGKQARRTGSSSPLGELFDHGCDAISSVFISIAACIAVKLGEYPGWMFFQCFSAMALFYCSHWQTYVTDALYLELLKNGVINEKLN